MIHVVRENRYVQKYCICMHTKKSKSIAIGLLEYRPKKNVYNVNVISFRKLKKLQDIWFEIEEQFK